MCCLSSCCCSGCNASECRPPAAASAAAHTAPHVRPPTPFVNRPSWHHLWGFGPASQQGFG
jgi:hypothetical protein